MARFLNTSATNYFLEELIKDARDRLILISPFLKLKDSMLSDLEDKNRLKIDVRIVYGKSELAAIFGLASSLETSGPVRTRSSYWGAARHLISAEHPFT